MDRNEFDICYTRYADMVYRIAYLITRNTADAEDVVQDTFFRCLQTEKPFVSEEHRKAWLIRTAQNAAKDRLRLAFRRFSTALTEDAAVPEEDTQQTELRDAILKLPAKYKLPLYLHYYEGYNTAEIAGILHIKESTVRSQMKRARDKLKLDLSPTSD